MPREATSLPVTQPPIFKFCHIPPTVERRHLRRSWFVNPTLSNPAQEQRYTDLLHSPELSLPLPPFKIPMSNSLLTCIIFLTTSAPARSALWKVLVATKARRSCTDSFDGTSSNGWMSRMCSFTHFRYLNNVSEPLEHYNEDFVPDLVRYIFLFFVDRRITKRATSLPDF